MTKLYRLILLVVSSLTLTVTCYSQRTSIDTAFISAAAKNARARHEVKTRTQSRLYNGSHYNDYAPLADESPYFMTEDWTEGSVVYDGQEYEHVSMLYNIYTDRLIVEHANGAFVQLIDSKLKSFIFGNIPFRRISKEEDSRRSIPTSFYQILYEKKTQLFARHIKNFSELIRDRELTREFDHKTTYYIVKNGAFYTAQNKSATLQILSDHKKEVKKFIREHKTFGKRERSAAMVELVQYYDSLNP